MIGNGLLEANQVTHITTHEADLADLFIFQNQTQPVCIFLEIVNPNLVAAFQKIASNPTANTTVAAGEKHSHAGMPSVL